MAIHPERPQSVGGVLDTTFQLYKASVFKVWPFSLVAAIASALPYIYVFVMIGPSADPFASAGVTYAVVNIAAIALSLWSMGVMYVQQHGIGVGQDPGVGAAFRTGVSRALPFFVLWIVLSLTMVIGFMLLVIPGLILMVSLALAPNLLMLERKGPFESLRASHSLVWGNWWRSAATLGVGWIIIMVAYMAVSFIGVLAVPFVGSEEQDALMFLSLWSLIVTGAMTLVVTPMYAALLVALYWDLSLRKHGGDLASRIAALNPA